MPDNPLQSLANYSRFVAEMLHRPTVVRSTVVVWPASPYTGMAEGEVVFVHGMRFQILRVSSYTPSMTEVVPITSVEKPPIPVAV